MAVYPYHLLPPSIQRLILPPKPISKKPVQDIVTSPSNVGVIFPGETLAQAQQRVFTKETQVSLEPTPATSEVKDSKTKKDVIVKTETPIDIWRIPLDIPFKSDLVTPAPGTREYAQWKLSGEEIKPTIRPPSEDVAYHFSTGTPGELTFAPSWPGRLESYGERATERTYEMRFEKDHFIGFDPETSDPIYVQESRPQIEHGYPMYDPDYGSAFMGIAEQKELMKTGLENVDLAKTSLPGAQENYDMVYGSPTGSKFKVDMDNDGAWDKYTYGPLPRGVKFGDFVYKTREEMLPILKENINKLEKSIDYGPELKKSLSDLSNTESLLRGYQRLGYEMDVKEGSYEFKEPLASKVYDWRYGKEWHSVIPKVGAAWKEGLFIPTAFAGAQSLITGDPSAWETKQEELAGGGLGFASTIEHKGLLGYGMEWGASEAMIYGVYIPIGTAGLGYGITGAGAGLKQAGKGFIAKVSEKIPSIFTGTGGKIITTTMKYSTKVLKPIAGAPSLFGATTGAFGKVMGTKAGEVLFTGGLFGVIEGPRFATIIADRPETFGSELGKTLLGWGGAIAGFKYGQKLWTTAHPPTKIPPSEEFFGPEKDWTMRFETGQKIMGKQPLTMKQIPSTLKDYSEFRIMGDFGKQYVTDIRSPLDIVTRGPYDVSLYGKAYMAKHDIPTTILGRFGYETKIIPKGTTFSFAKGFIRDPITGKIIKTSIARGFRTIGTGGPLTVAVPGPEATIPNVFWGKGTTRLLSTGEVVRVTGTGLLSTGKPGQVALSTWGRAKDITTIVGKGKGVKVSLSGKEIGFTKTGIGKWKPSIDAKFYSADTSQYMFYGKYKPIGFDIGEIYQTGPLAIITDTKPVTQMVISPVGKTSLLYSDQAVASLVKPVQPTTLTEILSLRGTAGEIAGGIGGAVGAIPAIATPITPSVSTMLAKTGTGFPSAVAGITRLGDEKGELLVAKPVSVLETKPVSIAEMTPPSIMGGLQIIEPVTKKEEKVDYRRTYTSDLKIGGELQEELEDRLTSGGLITEIDTRLGERTEEDVDIGMFTGTDVDMDMWQGQQQRLGLKSLLELKTVGEMDIIAMSVVTPVPTIPIPITPTPVIPLLFGDDEPLMIRKKKKKPKQKAKYRDEPKIAEKAFLADLISVTGTQARYKGKATHPPLTEEMWKLGEETGFVRMPTVELLKEKKKGKKKKKTPRLI